MAAVVNSYTSVLTGGVAAKTFAITPTTAGNSLVIEVAIRSKTTVYTGFTVADDQGNAYSIAQSAVNSSNQRTAAVIDCLAPITGTSQITITPTGGAGGFFGTMGVQEVSGVVSRGPGNTGAYVSSPMTVTNSVANVGTQNFVAAAIAAGSNNASQGISDPPSTYTSAGVNQNDNGTTSGSGECCYRVDSSAVTDSVSWVVGASGTTNDPAVLQSYTSQVPSPFAATVTAQASVTAALSTTNQWPLLPTLENLTPPDTGESLNADQFSLEIANPLVAYANQGRTNFSLAVQYALTANADSPTISGDAPGQTNKYYITPSTDGLTLNGLTTGSATLMQDGFVRCVVNGSTTHSFVLANNASSSIYNRFLCPNNGGGISVPPQGYVWLLYDALLGGSLIK